MSYKTCAGQYFIGVLDIRIVKHNFALVLMRNKISYKEGMLINLMPIIVMCFGYESKL